MTQFRFKAFRGHSLLFGIGGLVVIMALLVLYAKRLGWFEPKLVLHVVTESSEGLLPGTPVRLSGIRVGSLTGTHLLPDGRVRLELTVLERYRPWITPRSRARLTRASLLGSGVVALTPAPMDPARVPRQFVISAVVNPDLDGLLVGVDATRIQLQNLIRATTAIADQQVPSSLRQLQKTLAAGESATRTINQELPSTMAQARETMAVYAQTGKQADAVANETRLMMKALQPSLLHGVRDFGAAMSKSNSLLNRLGVWLEPAAQGAASDPAASLSTPRPPLSRQPEQPAVRE